MSTNVTTTTKTSAKALSYMKKYREDNLERLRSIDRKKYYKKKYNLEPEFLETYGNDAGDVFKMIKDFNKLKLKCSPELIMKLLEHLQSNINDFKFEPI
jgi:hypothetical protein